MFLIQTNYVTIFYRLFVLPHYCSAMVDLALLHSRKKYFKGKPNPQPNRNPNLETEQEPVPPREEEYMVFICATMWHESRKEMEKILQSIKRYSYTHNYTLTHKAIASFIFV